jgi:hypothetical protein
MCEHIEREKFSSGCNFAFDERNFTKIGFLASVGSAEIERIINKYLINSFTDPFPRQSLLILSALRTKSTGKWAGNIKIKEK